LFRNLAIGRDISTRNFFDYCKDIGVFERLFQDD
jgi:hypothetical protein